MPYSISIKVSSESAKAIAEARGNLSDLASEIVPDALDLLKERAVMNLSGVPFSSEHGSFSIRKRTGKAAASVQSQWPYGSPFKGRLFASAMTRYANNPEEYDYLAILEYGRGEVRPKYTPAMQSGRPGAARLAIPGGGVSLVNGIGGFRGMSGNYRFVKRLPPMPGRYWMQAAAEAARPAIEALATQKIDQFMEKRGL